MAMAMRMVMPISRRIFIIEGYSSTKNKPKVNLLVILSEKIFMKGGF